MARPFVTGLELARQFYVEIGESLLREALDGEPYSAALIGYGSEVQGFDTPRSTDHAWGPRFRVFLNSGAFQERAEYLDAVLDRELPDQFRGYPVRFAFPDDTAPRHWIHVTDVSSFFERQLGALPDGDLPALSWLTVPAQVLRELTGGLVFHDGLGVLEHYRRTLAWYPDDIWRYVLACQWLRLSQEEPFVGRCGEVGDDLGSAIVAARQVRDLMKLFLLMDRVYPPYSKWLGTAFRATTRAQDVTPHLAGALASDNWTERERHLSVGYQVAAERHNELGLTEPLDTAVRQFHGRPFQVLDAYRFTDALMATITDPAIRALPRVGAIDQYVDSTDMTDREAAEVRRQYINGPGSDRFNSCPHASS